MNVLQEDRENWIPAYFYKGYPGQLLSHAENHNFGHFMVVFPDGVNIHNQEIARLLADEKVEYVMLGNPSKVALTTLGKMGEKGNLVGWSF